MFLRVINLFGVRTFCRSRSTRMEASFSWSEGDVQRTEDRIASRIGASLYCFIMIVEQGFNILDKIVYTLFING